MARRRLSPITDGILSAVAGIVIIIIKPESWFGWALLVFGVLKTIVSQR